MFIRPDDRPRRTAAREHVNNNQSHNIYINAPEGCPHGTQTINYKHKKNNAPEGCPHGTTAYGLGWAHTTGGSEKPAARRKKPERGEGWPT